MRLTTPLPGIIKSILKSITSRICLSTSKISKPKFLPQTPRKTSWVFLLDKLKTILKVIRKSQFKETRRTKQFWFKRMTGQTHRKSQTLNRLKEYVNQWRHLWSRTRQTQRRTTVIKATELIRIKSNTSSSSVATSKIVS